MLQGYRTYIFGTAALITIALNLLGYVNPDIANILLTIFGFGGMITLRAAIE
jgi:hypothetical protein